MWQTHVYFISSLHCPQPSPLFYHYVHVIYSSSVPYGLVVWKIKTILGGIRTTKPPISLLICNFGRDILLGKLGRERNPVILPHTNQPILSTAMNAINVPTVVTIVLPTLLIMTKFHSEATTEKRKMSWWWKA